VGTQFTAALRPCNPRCLLLSLPLARAAGYDGAQNPHHPGGPAMAVKKILMLVGDYVQDLEVLGTKIEP
jgi:hypothetical protein